MRAAFSRVALRRSIALRLFWDCDLDACSVMRKDGPSLATKMSRVASSNAVDCEMSNVSSARVLLRLACCPPGPPDGPNRQCSSDSGISKRGMISGPVG